VSSSVPDGFSQQIQAQISAPKMLIDREKMLVLPFRKSRPGCGFCPEFNRKERKSLQL
jgi:hypothetical protein